MISLFFKAHPDSYLFYVKQLLYSAHSVWPKVNALATDSQNSVWDADGSSEKGSVASNI